ncbi:Calcium-activated chloride channel regulator 1 [Triplophysa tibetana]|uniref:Calcium-activated chloride channel regulator 1 n=1 Tax=Triplophysa tibetana TaxID=1572043 RepID=A0A5A9MZR6_9TELE|nr:Calcium-activated chloride channel regulator 1 [Triplophysa tibetana]
MAYQLNNRRFFKKHVLTMTLKKHSQWYPKIKDLHNGLTSYMIRSNRMFLNKHPTYSPKLKMQLDERISFFNERQTEGIIERIKKVTELDMSELNNTSYVLEVLTPEVNRIHMRSNEWLTTLNVNMLWRILIIGIRFRWCVQTQTGRQYQGYSAGSAMDLVYPLAWCRSVRRGPERHPFVALVRTSSEPDMFTEGSSYLFEAMEKKVYFKDITILVPAQWSGTDFIKSRTESFEKVVTFCREADHNGAAPNMQNEKCGNKATWTVIFEDSVDSDAFHSLKPLPSPPAPSFTVVQRMQRVVCLILDVSGSMRGSRIIQQRQAATYFIRHIIEDQGKVGIVTFSTYASTLKALTLIDSETTRENLINLLPTQADGSTNVCTGLNEALEVLKADNKDASGDEMIFLTDGEATDNINLCAPSAIESGAIIHTLALGPKAAKELREMADRTDGKFIIATDDITSNLLVDAFASLTIPTGDYTKEPIQLESMGMRTADWFNGTVSVDSTVGNKTSFLIIYEISAPTVCIQTPSGSKYSQTDLSEDPSAKTLTLKIPGTAESGDWKYSILSGGLQSLTITVTSQAARSDVPPIIVKAHVNQQLISGSKPVFVFAEVELNPPKPPVPEQPLVEGNFSRTATGESFEVTISNPPIYPPNKITDLNAEILENTVFLIWTAPGEDFDLGTAKSYEIRWSDDPKMLRLNFSKSSLVNTSAVSPKEAGSVEQHSFNMTIENGTTLFFALRSEDNDDAISEISNIAQASKILPAPNPPGISNPGLNSTVIIISVCVAAIVVCLIVAVTALAVKRRLRVDAYAFPI